MRGSESFTLDFGYDFDHELPHQSFKQGTTKHKHITDFIEHCREYTQARDGLNLAVCVQPRQDGSVQRTLEDLTAYPGSWEDGLAGLKPFASILWIVLGLGDCPIAKEHMSWWEQSTLAEKGQFLMYGMDNGEWEAKWKRDA